MSLVDLLLQAGMGILAIQGMKSVLGLCDYRAKVATILVGAFLFGNELFLSLVRVGPEIRAVTAVVFRALLVFVMPGVYSIVKLLFLWLQARRA